MPGIKTRCSFVGPTGDKCKQIAQRIVGDCSSCGGNKFCASHRLPENHQCASLDVVKAAARHANGEKLMSEATQQQKGLVQG